MRWVGPLFRSEFGDFSSCKSEIALIMRFRCQNQSLTYVSSGTELLEVYLGLRRSWEVSYVASKSCVFLKKNTKLDRGNFCESVCVRANAYRQHPDRGGTAGMCICTENRWWITFQGAPM